MRESYHGIEIEIIKEKSHIGWEAIYWSLTNISTWEEIDAGIERSGTMKGLMEELKSRVDRERK